MELAFTRDMFMKIAIISDIHDNIVNLKKCLSYLSQEKIEVLVCCGDMTNVDTLRSLAEYFSGQINLVRGNIEIYDEEEVELYKNIKYYGRSGILGIDGQLVGLCHEPFLMKYLLEKKEKLNIVFYGHTHKPWIEDRGGVKLVNPGTLGGVFQRATFSVWDTDSKSLELKVLDQII